MSEEMKSVYRFGAVSFVLSGALFLANSVLERLMGPPPPTGRETLEWITMNGALLRWTCEILFFAIAFLVPAIVALYQSLARTHRASAVAGCGMFAVAIPLLAMLSVLRGRLVFPVFDAVVDTPDLAQFVVVTYYGGLHAAALLFAVGTLAVSLAMRQGAFGKPTAYFGTATAALDVVGGYPDAIGPVAWLVCGVFLAAWFVAVGARLHAMSAHSTEDARPGDLVSPRYS